MAVAIRDQAVESRRRIAMKVVIACGGTGGHLFPGLAVAEVLRERGHTALIFISEKEIDALAVRDYAGLFRFEKLPSIGMPRLFSPAMLGFVRGFAAQRAALSDVLPRVPAGCRAGHGWIYLHRADARRADAEGADLHPRIQRDPGQGEPAERAAWPEPSCSASRSARSFSPSRAPPSPARRSARDCVNASTNARRKPSLGYAKARKRKRCS